LFILLNFLKYIFEVLIDSLMKLVIVNFIAMEVSFLLLVIRLYHGLDLVEFALSIWIRLLNFRINQWIHRVENILITKLHIFRNLLSDIIKWVIKRGFLRIICLVKSVEQLSTLFKFFCDIHANWVDWLVNIVFDSYEIIFESKESFLSHVEFLITDNGKITESLIKIIPLFFLLKEILLYHLYQISGDISLLLLNKDVCLSVLWSARSLICKLKLMQYNTLRVIVYRVRKLLNFSIKLTKFLS
jgi:hypothetical protein